MSKSGGASLASGLLSALASKTIATVAGPSYLAMLATLQQARQAGLVVATANGQTALVQGLGALAGRKRREYVRTVACLMGILTLSVALTFALWGSGWRTAANIFPRTSSGPLELGPFLFSWLALPLVLSSCFVFLSALLSALGRVGALAAIQVVAAFAMAAGAPLASHYAATSHVRALVVLLSSSAAASVAGALWALWPLRSRYRQWFRGDGRIWSGSAARHFLAIAGAMSLSGFAAAAVLLTVRGQIAAKDGLAVTGQWDAAWNVSMNHATLVLGSLQTHYLPAVVNARTPEEKAGKLSAVLMAGSGVAALVIAAIALTKPWVLVILYSHAFRPAAAYLRWTLLGDYLKVSSWIVSIPLLAEADMKPFLLADLAACATFLLSARILGGEMGTATAASVGFALMYAAHLVFCGGTIWKRHRLRPSRPALLVWLAGLGVVGAASAFSWNQA